MGKIGINQLSQALIELINSKSGAGVSVLKNNVTITQDTAKITIGIDLFNSTVDELIVYKNSVFIAESIDYKINSDNTISPLVGSMWEASGNEPLAFNFMVFKSIPNTDILIDGNLLVPQSVAESKLHPDVVAKLNNSGSGGGITQEDIDNIKHAILGNVPLNLNTLEKIAVAINNDPNVFNTILGKINEVKNNISSAVNDTSSTKFASSAAVKTAYDKGNEALTKANSHDIVISDIQAELNGQRSRSINTLKSIINRL